MSIIYNTDHGVDNLDRDRLTAVRKQDMRLGGNNSLALLAPFALLSSSAPNICPKERARWDVTR